MWFPVEQMVWHIHLNGLLYCRSVAWVTERWQSEDLCPWILVDLEQPSHFENWFCSSLHSVFAHWTMTGEEHLVLVWFMLLRGSLKLVIFHLIAYVLVISYMVEKQDSPALTTTRSNFSFLWGKCFLFCESSEFWCLSAILHLGVPCFVIWIGCGIYALAGLDYDCPIYASHIAGMISLYYRTHLLIGWDGVSFFFWWTGV
jgi:hypothetical protein